MGDLQKRFTIWMKKLVQNARIDYLRRTEKKVIEIPFTNLSERDRIKLAEKSVIYIDDSVFQNIKIEAIYKTLPIAQRNILWMLFVNQMNISEISACIGRSRQYIYNQKYLALKKMKEEMMRYKSD